MSGDTTTGKIIPRASETPTGKNLNTRQDDAAYSLLKSLGKLGGVGTLTIIGILISGFAWLKGEITDQTKSIVREEIRPLDDRVRQLEVEQEVQRRMDKNP